MSASPELIAGLEQRRAYTGESVHTALQQLRAHQTRIRLRPTGAPVSPLAPAAETTEQMVLEQHLLRALATAIGPHNPVERGGHPYGITAVTPLPDHVRIHLDTEALKALPPLVLPRLPRTGFPESAGAPRVLGIPGLRQSTSRGDVQLSLPGHRGVILLRQAARTWRHAVEQLQTELARTHTLLWQAELSDQERRALQHDEELDLEQAWWWSTALRRIALWRDATALDLPSQVGRPVLAGPHPGLAPATLAAGPAPAPAGKVVACLGHRAGTGRTVITLNVATAWAELGLRVLLTEVIDPRNGNKGWLNEILAASPTRQVTPQLQARVLYEAAHGGRLWLADALPIMPIVELTETLQQLRAQADVVLLDLDTSSHRVHLAHAAAADAVFSCVKIPAALLGQVTTSYSPRLQAVLRHRSRGEEVLSWLEDSFLHFQYLQAPDLDRDPVEVLTEAVSIASATGRDLPEVLEELAPTAEEAEVAGLGWEEDEAEIAQWERQFLPVVAELGQRRFGDLWTTEHRRWPAEVDTVNLHPSVGDLVSDGAITFTVARSDIIETFHPREEQAVVADLQSVIERDGLHPEDVAGLYLGVVPNLLNLNQPEAIESLVRLGARTVPAVTTAVPACAALNRWAEHGRLPILHEAAAPGVAALRKVAAELYERLASGNHDTTATAPSARNVPATPSSGNEVAPGSATETRAAADLVAALDAASSEDPPIIFDLSEPGLQQHLEELFAAHGVRLTPDESAVLARWLGDHAGYGQYLLPLSRHLARLAPEHGDEAALPEMLGRLKTELAAGIAP